MDLIEGNILLSGARHLNAWMNISPSPMKAMLVCSFVLTAWIQWVVLFHCPPDHLKSFYDVLETPAYTSNVVDLFIAYVQKAIRAEPSPPENLQQYIAMHDSYAKAAYSQQIFGAIGDFSKYNATWEAYSVLHDPVRRWAHEIFGPESSRSEVFKGCWGKPFSPKCYLWDREKTIFERLFATHPVALVALLLFFIFFSIRRVDRKFPVTLTFSLKKITVPLLLYFLVEGTYPFKSNNVFLILIKALNILPYQALYLVRVWMAFTLLFSTLYDIVDDPKTDHDNWLRAIFSPRQTIARARRSKIGSTAIPTGLIDAEIDTYKTLLRVVQQRYDAGHKAPKVVVISDLAKDYDDLTAMIVLKELHRIGVIELKGFVANLLPARRRALFGRGALDSLGLSNIPIAIGTDGTDEEKEVLDHEFQGNFTAPDGTVLEDGEGLLTRTCQDSVKVGEKLTIVLLSSLRDIWQFAEKHPDLLTKAVSYFVLQGGYSISAEGNLIPDTRAANNRFDLPAAEAFHTFMQETKTPSTVYTKVSAFATPITTKLFLEMEKSGHPLGLYLRRVQIQQDINFYKRACNLDPEKRFAPFLDQEWFLRNRSSWYEAFGEEDTPKPKPVGDGIVPYLTKVVVYDALAALGAAGADTMQELATLKVANIHEIIGVEAQPKDTGINEERMAAVLSALMKGSLLASVQNL